MLVDLAAEAGQAKEAVVRIFEDLHDPGQNNQLIAVTISDPLGGRVSIGGATGPTLPRGEWLNFYDLPRMGNVRHEFETDYFFDAVEMDESGSVWVDVAMPDGTTRRVDVEADHDLGNTLIDFLEFLIATEPAQTALRALTDPTDDAVAHLLLNVADGGQQRLTKLS